MVLKAEEQMKKNKAAKKEQVQQENDLSQVKVNQFFNFFKVLKERDSDTFTRVVNRNCQLKAAKKNDKVVQETAMLKLAKQ